MKTEKHEDRTNNTAPRRIVLGLALAACGSMAIAESMRPTPGDVAFSLQKSGMAVGVLEETNKVVKFDTIRKLFGDASLFGDTNNLPAGITLGGVNVHSSQRKAEVTIHIEGQENVILDVALSGPDGNALEIMQEGIMDARFQTVNVVDYENPMDADRDNIYEATVMLSTSDMRSHIMSMFDGTAQTYKLIVLDSANL